MIKDLWPQIQHLVLVTAITCLIVGGLIGFIIGYIKGANSDK